MSYPIDVYRGDADVQRNYVSFGTFVALFPQLDVYKRQHLVLPGL